MIDRAEEKRQAREILRRAQVSPWLFALVFFLLSEALGWTDTYVSGSLVDTLRQYYPQFPIPAFFIHPDYPRNAVLFVSILTRLLSAVLGAGVALYHLGIRRGEEMGVATLFDGFAMAGKIILLWLMEGALIFLWSMLFVIPGIVAMYRYRFALYNLLEDPDLRPAEALRMSSAQTYGVKTELFKLDLTFLGWAVLSELTFGLVSIWAVPYYVQTNVGCFQTVKGIRGIGYGAAQDRPDDPFGP